MLAYEDHFFKSVIVFILTLCHWELNMYEGNIQKDECRCWACLKILPGALHCDSYLKCYFAEYLKSY